MASRGGRPQPDRDAGFVRRASVDRARALAREPSSSHAGALWGPPRAGPLDPRWGAERAVEARPKSFRQDRRRARRSTPALDPRRAPRRGGGDVAKRSPGAPDGRWIGNLAGFSRTSTASAASHSSFAIELNRPRRVHQTEVTPPHCQGRRRPPRGSQPGRLSPWTRSHDEVSVQFERVFADARA